MKYLFAALAVCLCLPLQAKVLVDEVTFETDWPSLPATDPFLFLLDYGDHSCPGGTYPDCDDANMSMTRGLEIYACFGNSVPYDSRVEGTTWIQINGNTDMDGNGVGWGIFKMVPSVICSKDLLDEPEVYWEGSWQGKRSKVSDDPPLWIEIVEVVGRGVGGDLEGQKLNATEVLTSYTVNLMPNELLGIDEPESIVHAVIKSKAD
jgi:hypothetical protein